MPTVNQIADKISRGQILQSNLVNTAIIAEKAGCTPTNWGTIVRLSNLIDALTTQVLIPDYTSDTTVALYNKISSIIGFQYIDGATLDPNAQQAEGVVFIGNQPSQVFNTERVTFTAQTTVSLLSYQTAYYSHFGNSPILSLWVQQSDGTYALDEATAPVITYVVSGQAGSGIASISWSFGVATSGYVQIFGLSS